MCCIPSSPPGIVYLQNHLRANPTCLLQWKFFHYACKLIQPISPQCLYLKIPNPSLPAHSRKRVSVGYPELSKQKTVIKVLEKFISSFFSDEQGITKSEPGVPNLVSPVFKRLLSAPLAPAKSFTVVITSSLKSEWGKDCQGCGYPGLTVRKYFGSRRVMNSQQKRQLNIFVS